MERTISLVFVAWFMFFNGCLLFKVDAGGPKVKAMMKLIHRHSRELGENTGTSLGAPVNSKERIKQLVHSDHARIRTISQRLGKKINNMEELSKLNLVELPMRSAADLGNGQYFVSVRIGTPSKKFLLLVDTGSVITWIMCKYDSNDWKNRLLLNERVFQPDQSSTYKSIPCGTHCSSDLIAFNTSCPSPRGPCQFNQDYLDGTMAEGYLGNDTVKIRLSSGTKIKLENITIGCARTVTNTPCFRDIDGLMGLGCEYQAFAVKAASKFGYKFSYCLVDHLSPTNLVNFLVFGDQGTQVPNMQHTQLVLAVLGSFYALNVSGISINDKMLDIPSEVLQINQYSGSGGMILDSGSTITMLVKPIYDKVIAAFLPFIGKYKSMTCGHGLEYCFLKRGFDKSLAPRFAIHFADGAKFEPPVKSYMIDVEDPNVNESMVCVGFQPLHWPDISIIGNILQQNHLWEFDLAKKRLSFAPSSCTVE